MSPDVDMANRCEWCGSDMGDCHYLRKFCSDRCRRADRTELERQAKRAAMAGKRCETCGSPMPLTKRQHAKYCSKNCQPRFYRERRTCPVCDKVFRIVSPGQVYCSKPCVKNAKREDHPRACQVCDAPMAAPLPEQKYCSERCNQMAYRRRRRGDNTLSTLTSTTPARSAPRRGYFT